MPLPGSTAAARLVADCADLPPEHHARLLDVSDLTEAERHLILDGLADHPAVGPLCAALLADWERLTAAERVALLLVLAEAIASRSTEDE